MDKPDLGHQLISGGLYLIYFTVVAFCPIYCGWRIRDQRESKAAFATSLADWFFGALTMLLGLLYFVLFAIYEGMQLRTMWFDSLNGEINWEAVPLFGLMFLVVTVLFILPLFALFGGLFICGANVCIPHRWRQTLPTFPGDWWQPLIGGAALLFGLLGSIWVSVMAIASLIDSP